MAETWPPQDWQNVTVLLAVSGGADSIALLRAVHALRPGGAGRLAVAHFNHRLRGEPSDADEAFVVALCRQLEIPCEVGRSDSGPSVPDPRDGLEAAARSARYRFLRHTAARLGARYVVTAHTADDQAETILHRILRGTGIGGLAGMARARALGPAATLIRPLLGFRRAELLAYLDDLGQSYRSDDTNADTRFTRNRIRHELLPVLGRQFNPGIVDALLRLGTLAGEVQAVVHAMVDGLAARCVTSQTADAVELQTAPLSEQPMYVIRELLLAVWRGQGWPMQAMGFEQWDLLAKMVCHRRSAGEARSKHMFPGGISAELADGRLRLARPGDRENR